MNNSDEEFDRFQRQKNQKLLNLEEDYQYERKRIVNLQDDIGQLDAQLKRYEQRFMDLLYHEANGEEARQFVQTVESDTFEKRKEFNRSLSDMDDQLNELKLDFNRQYETIDGEKF